MEYQEFIIVEQTFGFAKGGTFIYENGNSKKYSGKTDSKILSILLNQLGSKGWQLQSSFQAPNLVTAKGAVTFVLAKAMLPK